MKYKVVRRPVTGYRAGYKDNQFFWWIYQKKWHGFGWDNLSIAACNGDYSEEEAVVIAKDKLAALESSKQKMAKKLEELNNPREAYFDWP